MSKDFSFHDAGELIDFDYPEDRQFPFMKIGMIPVTEEYVIEREMFQTSKFIVVPSCHDAKRKLLPVNGNYYLVVDDMTTEGNPIKTYTWIYDVIKKFGKLDPIIDSPRIGGKYLLVIPGDGMPGGLTCPDCKSVVGKGNKACPYCGNLVANLGAPSRDEIIGVIRNHRVEEQAMVATS